ncbi:MAG: hypothetical protein U0441_19575 [Polyangiaceae bacterium]
MRHGTSMRLPSPSPGQLGTRARPLSARHGTSAAPRTGVLRPLAGGLFVLGLLSSAGCGGGNTHVEDTGKGPAQLATTPPPPSLQLAGGGNYEVVPPAAGKERCTTKSLPPPAACAGAATCAVSEIEIASCDAPVSQLTLSMQTAAFLLGPQRPDGWMSAFGIWGADKAPRVVETPGSAPVPARRPDGHLLFARVEGQRVVDYLLDKGDLLRRVWDIDAGQHAQVSSAAWFGERLSARVTTDPSRPTAYQDFQRTDQGSVSKADLRIPQDWWGSPWNQAREPDGRWLSVGYGAHGVGLFTDVWGWGVPQSVTQTGTALRALAGGQRAPVIGFNSFDPNDRSGVHVIVPAEAFPRNDANARSPRKALDLHILVSRAGNKSDCPVTPETKARPCSKAETHTEGFAMARTPSDGRVWLAFYTAVFEHSAATAEMVCPEVHCKDGRPCAQPICSLRETKPKDDQRVELHLYRLSEDRASLEQALSMRMSDTAIGGGVATLEMDAEGSALILAHTSGNNGVARLRIDTTRLAPLPAPAGDVEAVPIILVPMGSE